MGLYIQHSGGNRMTSSTGGTITCVNGFRIHTFTSSGAFSPSGIGTVEVLIVGAGGGAGNNGPGDGGGGAGGLIFNSSYSIPSTNSLCVMIGSGGAGNSAGGCTMFGPIVAYGGGRGGEYAATHPGGNGASGGGGSGRGFSDVGGDACFGQGNKGGCGKVGVSDSGGGGGGAATPGCDGISNGMAGNGGWGLPYNINGTTQYYAGGGAGGADYSGCGGTGGCGGGGWGVNSTQGGTSGCPNTGGGGGSRGPNGGSGVVIIRYSL
jgi:hypothetical protein